jgi:hypothetical protein
MPLTPEKRDGLSDALSRIRAEFRAATANLDCPIEEWSRLFREKLLLEVQLDEDESL